MLDSKKEQNEEFILKAKEAFINKISKDEKCMKCSNYVNCLTYPEEGICPTSYSLVSYINFKRKSL